ncbi:hypothetical protein Tco_0869448 [Tanacetum coccineum]
MKKLNILSKLVNICDDIIQERNPNNHDNPLRHSSQKLFGSELQLRDRVKGYPTRDGYKHHVHSAVAPIATISSSPKINCKANDEHGHQILYRSKKCLGCSSPKLFGSVARTSEEPFEDLESEHKATSYEIASPPKPSPATIIPPPPTVIPPPPTVIPTPTHQRPYLRQTARMRVIPPTQNPFGIYESVVPTQSMYHIGESSTPAPTRVTDRYLRQAAMDQPARPTGPRLDMPRNYRPDMNCQEL